MARVWQSGFELNSTAANGEFTGTSGTMGVVTSPVRTGTYAFRTNPSSATGSGNYRFRSADTAEDTYVRFYLYITTAPGTTVGIAYHRDNAGKTSRIGLRMTASRTLQLYNFEDSVQIGSDSAALNLSEWYMVELRQNSTTLASTAAEARLNGSSFASGTANLAGSSCIFHFGVLSSTTANFCFDDIAINDSTGSFQNSWAGEGSILHLRPNAAGDNSDWTNDYLSVDEVAPDDATTLVSSNTLNQIDDYNIDVMPVTGTMNVVAVGVRYNGVGSSANASFVLRIKASASGTVEESSSLTANTTTWRNNTAAIPFNYSLILYDLPGASTTPWTKADLDTAQIGYRLSATNTNAIQISTVWLSVDYAPLILTSTITGIESITGISSLTF